MGKIVTGTELIRRKANGEAFALTTPLIKKLMVPNSENQKAAMYGSTEIKHHLTAFISFGSMQVMKM